jgi:hypothetical protein
LGSYILRCAFPHGQRAGAGDVYFAFRDPAAGFRTGCANQVIFSRLDYSGRDFLLFGVVRPGTVKRVAAYPMPENQTIPVNAV